MVGTKNARTKAAKARKVKAAPGSVNKKKPSALAILESAAPLPETEPESIWKEEVEHLLGDKFKSLVEVIDAIAARVCIRLGQEGDTNLHEFIVMMLDTDEEIRQELKTLFNVTK